MTALLKTEAELRSAVASRLYGDVQRLLVLYGSETRAHIRSLPAGSQELLDAQRRVQEMLDWTNRMIRAGRESIALELRRLPRVQRYLQAPPAPASNWQVEG